MRVLVAAKNGSSGHLLPMLPLAEALREQGHDVAISSGAERQDHVARLGFRFFAAGLSWPEVAALRRAIYPEWPWGGDLEHVYTLLFTRVQAPQMAHDLLDILDEFRPDVVVHDLGEFGTPIAACRHGIPWVTHGWGLPLPESLLRAAGSEIAPLWEAFGLEPRDYGGMGEHLYVDLCPPSLDPHDGPTIPSQALAPVVADIPTGSRDRRLVYVTFGTSSAFNDAADTWRLALAAVASLDVAVVATTGRGGNDRMFGDVPRNVVIEEWHDQADLMPACAVVLCHGGSGTVLTALGYGVPLLVFPQGADQFRNADAVERSGAGLVYRGGSPDLSVLVRRLLDEPAFREAASHVAHEIAAMPSPSDVIASVTTVTRG